MLVALPSAVWISRAYAAAVLRGWGCDDDRLIDDARLVVSELVTNAVQALGYATTRPSAPALLAKEALIRITLTHLDGGGLRIDVWDSSPGFPVLEDDVPDDSENGRGLFIVAAVAASTGYQYCERSPGKTVFAVLTP
ncbi:ATP-binding protein [Spongiactinospora sp. TRM90649]|uniref:ATP-binding protein n=1 Tax=Spongiactinospora sp. TRM90649 TaxID=3031114 RepID=UPI0023F72B40|nr:ATP-binding protein [Spongiactinospora sp. TRM90649]MDF5751833.1 ATP-binding protein [Spongiactinospora sp. TRM90649]